MKFGADVRMIRMTTDQLGGTTYTFPNITAFLANTPSAIQYLGDISAPSVFNNGATGLRHTEQQYFVGFAQDEWHAGVEPDAELRPALRLLHADEGTRQPDRQVQHRDRHDRSEHDAVPRVEEEQLPAARVDDLRAGQDGVPRRLRCLRRPGPGRRPDSADRERSRQHDAQHRPGAAVSRSTRTLLVANFTSNPNNRSYAPRAYAPEYNIPEKVYQYTASVQQELGGNFTASAAYVGAQGRNLFLRTITNHITDVVTNPNPASAAFVIREFSIVQRDAAGNITGVQNPYAEIDVKTSGGRSDYNAMMLSLNRRSANGAVDEHASTRSARAAAPPAVRTKPTRPPTTRTPTTCRRSTTTTATTTSTSATPSTSACSTRCPTARAASTAPTPTACRRRSSAAGTSAASPTPAAACPCRCRLSVPTSSIATRAGD